MKNNSRMNVRFVHMMMLAMSLFCISCDREDPVTGVMEYPVTVEVGSARTKVGISDDNSLYWQHGDQLAFRATGVSGAVATAVLTLNEVDSGLGTAKFKGVVTMSEQPVKCEFAYNSGEFTQDGKVVFDYSAQDGTHKPYLYGTAEYSESMTCTLSHVGGLLRIKVPQGVTSLSLSSNWGSFAQNVDGSYMADENGLLVYTGQNISKVSGGEGGFEPLEGEEASHLINVAVPEGQEVVYAFAPAVEYVDGISVVCNHSDGSKMFKSFSKTGGIASSYVLAPGSVLDLDMGTYSGFAADCTLEWEHTYEGDDKILTGTDVSVTGFTFSGAPSKIIDHWGVAVYDGSTLVRWTSEGGVFEQKKGMEDQTGSWPLLIPNKEYKVYAICSINGHTLSFESENLLTVGYPDITVIPIAETSWSYRTTPSVANGCGNNTIERLALKVNVSNNILSNPSYGFKANMTDTTISLGSGDLDFFSTSGLRFVYNASTGECELKDGDGLYVLGNLAWGTHKVTASVSFAGKPYNAAESVPAYVTGLPYRHNFREAGVGLDGGTMSGKEEFHVMNGYQLYYVYYWNAFSKPSGDKSVYYSRTFSLPEEIDVMYNTGFLNGCTGLSTGSTTVYSGIVNSTSSPSTSKYQTISDKGDGTFDAYGSMAAKEENGCVLTGSGKFGPSSRISASTAGTSNPPYGVQYGVFLYKLEVLYQ